MATNDVERRIQFHQGKDANVIESGPLIASRRRGESAARPVSIRQVKDDGAAFPDDQIAVFENGHLGPLVQGSEIWIIHARGARNDLASFVIETQFSEHPMRP